MVGSSTPSGLSAYAAVHGGAVPTTDDKESLQGLEGNKDEDRTPSMVPIFPCRRLLLLLAYITCIHNNLNLYET